MESCILSTGVLQYQADKACSGYTLYSPMRQKVTYLIDMEGYIVKEWKHDCAPGLFSVLLENGHLLRGGLKTPKYTEHGGEGGCIQEFDWDGNLVWEYVHYAPESCQHHSFKRCKNGNTLVLCWKRHSWDEARQKGRLEQNIPEGENDGLWASFIEEVSPEGKVVWTWDMWDHAGEGPDELNINYVVGNKYYMQGFFDWAHINNVDDVPEHNEILLCSRSFGEILFVDKATGKITYRFGNPAAYGQGRNPSFLDPGDQEFFGPHCATWLGNGKVLLFDNGWMHPLGNRSRIVELDRTCNAITWQWTSPSPNSFSSPIQSSVQMLPNGNVLACATEHGHFIEVVPNRKSSLSEENTDVPAALGSVPGGGEIAWEFINPATRLGCRAVLTDKTETRADTTNAVHRAHRYTADHPALQGRNLSRKRPFMETCPEGPWKKWQNLLSMESHTENSEKAD